MGHGIRYRRITRHRLPRIGATMCLDRAHRPHQIQWRIAALLLVIGLAGAARATEAIEENFFDMSLEDLINGVINITTRSARDTQGWLFDGVAGTEEQIGSVRYGGQIDDRTYYRVYGKYRNVDDAVFADGDRSQDGWQALRGGFRIDRYASD